MLTTTTISSLASWTFLTASGCCREAQRPQKVWHGCEMCRGD